VDLNPLILVGVDFWNGHWSLQSSFDRDQSADFEDQSEPDRLVFEHAVVRSGDNEDTNQLHRIDLVIMIDAQKLSGRLTVETAGGALREGLDSRHTRSRLE